MALSYQPYFGKQINVLVVVNTDGVTGNPGAYFGNYVRMIDDQRDDSGQFGSELTVACHPGDTLIFRVCGVKPDVNINLIQFIHTGGQMVLSNLSYNPQIEAWQGTVSKTGDETYHWKIRINNKNYEWDPFIHATNPPPSFAR